MTFTREQLEASFNYLDELRETGVTNMWGASTYLREFVNNGYCPNTFQERDSCLDGVDMSHPQSRDILGMWMQTFSAGSVSERVDCALKNL